MENRNKANKFKRNLGINILFFFIVGFILCFPISIENIFNFNFQEKIALTLQPLIKWVGIHFFDLESDFTTLLISDSPGLYILLFLLVIISFFLGSICVKYIPFNSKKIEYWLKIMISYYLSFILFIYGTNKIFKFQFYEPEPNTLFTPLGYLSRDILYWSVVGSSYSYNILIGLIQIIIAIFLLFRKSRIIGAAGAVVLFVNIVIINFTYDISVKVFSTFLLFISLIVAFPLFKFIYLFFYKNEKPLSVFNQWIPSKDSKKKILIYVILKTLVVSVILLKSFFIYFETGIFNGDNSPKYSLFGAYQIIYTEEIMIRRFFFHSKGYFIVQDKNDKLKDYRILSMKSRKIELQDYDKQVSYLNYKIVGDTLSLNGVLDSIPFSVKGKKIDLQKLPLLQSQFHLTIDDIRE